MASPEPKPCGRMNDITAAFRSFRTAYAMQDRGAARPTTK